VINSSLDKNWPIQELPRYSRRRSRLRRENLWKIQVSSLLNRNSGQKRFNVATSFLLISFAGIGKVASSATRVEKSVAALIKAVAKWGTSEAAPWRRDVLREN